MPSRKSDELEIVFYLQLLPARRRPVENRAGAEVHVFGDAAAALAWRTWPEVRASFRANALGLCAQVATAACAAPAFRGGRNNPCIGKGLTERMVQLPCQFKSLGIRLAGQPLAEKILRGVQPDYDDHEASDCRGLAMEFLLLEVWRHGLRVAVAQLSQTVIHCRNRA